MCIATAPGKAQTIIGKWYAIDENFLGEFSIKADSLLGNSLSPESSNSRRERFSIKHFGIYKIEDKEVLIITDPKGDNEIQYRAMTFFSIKEGEAIQLAANGVTESTKTIAELISLIKNDTTKMFGNIFYHKDRLRELEKLKDPNTMPVEDFRAFLTTFADKRDKQAYMESRMSSTFRDQIVNQTLIDLGYNPIFRKDWENRFFEKFLSDEEVRKIYEERYRNY